MTEGKNTQSNTAGETPPADAWQCLNCDYVHYAPAPPAFCPVCGAPPERFAPVRRGGGRPGRGDSPRHLA